MLESKSKVIKRYIEKPCYNKYIQFILSNSNKLLIIFIFLLANTSCSRTSTFNFLSVKDDLNMHINERTIRGKQDRENTYKFVETLYYDFTSKGYSVKDLSMKKTICVGSDCKTSSGYKFRADNAHKVKALFDVNKDMLKTKFTLTTNILLKDATVSTSSYIFYPKDCLKKTCRQSYD